MGKPFLKFGTLGEKTTVADKIDGVVKVKELLGKFGKVLETYDKKDAVDRTMSKIDELLLNAKLITTKIVKK